MKIGRDMWLSEIFGYDVFKVILFTQATRGSPPTIPAHGFSPSSQSGSGFFYAKVPTQNVDQVLALSSLGFNVVDVTVTFERKPASIAQQEAGTSLVVRDFLPEDCEAVLDIAASCFRYSRFHMDPEIPDEMANAIKCAWVKSYIQKKRGERLLVSLMDDRPVGFLAVLENTVNGVSARMIDLIGVDTPYQGRGVGKSLLEFFVNAYFKKCDLLRVGTQISNVPSMRLYECSGFRIAETAYVLHGHIKNGQLQR